MHPSVGALLSAHQSIGVPEPVKLFGTEEQKRRVPAPLRARRDQRVPADRARRRLRPGPAAHHRDADRGRQRLRPRRRQAVDHQRRRRRPARGDGAGAEAEGHRGGITAFVVEADSPGITVEHRNAFMGLRGIENGVTRFHQVRVPAENRIGREGQGLKIALTTLNTGRLSLPAMCAAAGKWSLKIAREWSAERVQWGRPIGAARGGRAARSSFIAATAYALEAVLDLSGAAGRRRAATTSGSRRRSPSCGPARWPGRSPTSWSRSAAGADTRPPSRWRPAASAACRPSRCCATCGSTGSSRARPRSCTCSSPARPSTRTCRSPATSSTRRRPAGQGQGRGRRRAASTPAGCRSWSPARARVPGVVRRVRPARHAPALRRAASRKLARSTFYGMARWQAKLEHQQGFLGRIVDIGAELFAMSAACVAGRDAPRRTTPSRARRRTSWRTRSAGRPGCGSRRSSSGCGTTPTTATYALAQRVLDGDYTWLEEGIARPVRRHRPVDRAQEQRPQPARTSRRSSESMLKDDLVIGALPGMRRAAVPGCPGPTGTDQGALLSTGGGLR